MGGKTSCSGVSVANTASRDLGGAGIDDEPFRRFVFCITGIVQYYAGGLVGHVLLEAGCRVNKLRVINVIV
jgi:hypothetical protein